MTRDPLSEHVHLSKLAGLKNGIQGAAGTFAARLTRRSDFCTPESKTMSDLQQQNLTRVAQGDRIAQLILSRAQDPPVR